MMYGYTKLRDYRFFEAFLPTQIKYVGKSYVSAENPEYIRYSGICQISPHPNCCGTILLSSDWTSNPEYLSWLEYTLRVGVRAAELARYCSVEFILSSAQYECPGAKELLDKYGFEIMGKYYNRRSGNMNRIYQFVPNYGSDMEYAKECPANESMLLDVINQESPIKEVLGWSKVKS